jgi:hypothetical protein
MLIENFWRTKSRRKILEGLKTKNLIFTRTKNIFIPFKMLASFIYCLIIVKDVFMMGVLDGFLDFPYSFLVVFFFSYFLLSYLWSFFSAFFSKCILIKVTHIFRDENCCANKMTNIIVYLQTIHLVK